MAGRTTKKAAKKPATKTPTPAEPEKVNRRGNKRGTNANSQANLKSWQKGESGNPAGMAPGTKHRATVISKWLESSMTAFNPLEKKRQKLSVLDFMVIAMLQQALMKGNVKAFQALLDYAYGKEPMPLRHAGEDGGADPDPDRKELTDDELAAIAAGK